MPQRYSNPSRTALPTEAAADSLDEGLPRRALSPEGLPLVRGVRAVATMRKTGASIYVFNSQKGWIDAPYGVVERIERHVALDGPASHSLAEYAVLEAAWIVAGKPETL